jgi:hypothetical protein
MDIRDLRFDSELFDVAIDKGTMDAMMTAKADVWVCNTSRCPYLSLTRFVIRILQKRSSKTAHKKSMKS